MWRRSMALLVSGCLLVPVHAQDFGDWSLDPSVIDAGHDLLMRAPTAEMDALFQAVHASSQAPSESRALCTLFEPDADRSLSALNAFAAQLPPASRNRFASAVANVLVASMQSPPQAYDAAAARQSLKAAGVTAAFLHDGFVAGLDGAGTAPAAREARCQSIRWLLDAIAQRPANERAAMTRLLLGEGLARLAP